MSRSNQIPQYTAGTIAIGAQSGGVWPVTGTGTAWLSPDGVTNWTIAVGDMLVCSGCLGIVGAVGSNTSISLSYWTGGTVSAGASYAINRYSGVPSSIIAGLVTNLLSVGSTSAPFAAFCALAGAGRINFTDDGAGNILVNVRSNAVGQTDADYVTALTINETTGALSATGLLSTASSPSFKNRIRNASFAINQRAVSGTVTLAAGAYGHDGVRAGASGATYTFGTSGIDTTISVSAGSIILPVESSMIEGGTYTLSQAGTALARIWQGTGYTGSGGYVSCTPFNIWGVAMSANTQTNIEFTTGTVLRPQFEPGTVATAFERRPPGVELGLCQRYYQAGARNIQIYGAAGWGYIDAVALKVTMRAAPYVILTVTAASNITLSAGSIDAEHFDIVKVLTGTGSGGALGTWTASAEI
jgi:hypothetical protein